MKADDLVPLLRRRRDERQRRRRIARRQRRHARDRAPAHRAGHVECQQQARARRLDVAERHVERGVERVDHLADRSPLAATAYTATRRVRPERGEQRDRVHTCSTDPLCIAELRDRPCRAVGARSDDADARHRREVADQRRHRHVVEQRLPDVGRRQVLRLERLAREAVLADECGRRRAATSTPAHGRSPRPGAGDRPSRRRGRSTRTAERARPTRRASGCPSRHVRAGCASRSRSRCVTPSRCRYFTAW